MIRRLPLWLLALVIALVGAVPGAAQTATSVSSVDIKGLEKELRCVTCNTPLDISNSESAQELKRYIRQRASEGWTAEQIKADLVDQFGREILTTPPKEGFDLIAWIVPIALVGAGIAAIPFLTRAWARRNQRVALPGADATAEEQARLDEELRRLED
ncbi:MAG: cytochrome c-type biogenesis protein CcmH [Actinobacteria bacterium]|nr:cytochrome c-type biogenesis protein CcmH [Thermoleophilia bacterium]MCB9012019.1 cytochrome c-type biogenesis protein CcmH [Actinomycetota bacterium]